MTALTLPFPTVTAAEVAVRSGWAVVDGVSRQNLTGLHLRPNGTQCGYVPFDTPDGTAWYCTKCGANGVIGPPPEWVRAAEPCKTCDGEGLTMGYGRTHECERCLGVGKPRVEVVAPCPKCCGEPNSNYRNGRGRVFWGSPPCPTCNARCSIHVAWVTVTEVLPVVDAEKDHGAQTVVAVYDDGSVELWEPNKGNEGISTDITADVAHLGPPADLVNRFLLKLEAL